MLDLDWVSLAHHFNIPDKDILKIQMQYIDSKDQSLAILHSWANNKDGNVTGEELQLALKRIGRIDIVQKYLLTDTDIEDVTEEFKAWLRPSPGMSWCTDGDQVLS